MRHRAARPLLDRWRFSTLPMPVRTGMLVGGGLVVLGAALGVGLLDGSAHQGGGPAPLSARTSEGRVAEAPAAQHTDPAPSPTAHPHRTRTAPAAGSPTAPAPAPARTTAPAGATTRATATPVQPSGAAMTRPGHGHGLAKGHDKH